MRVVWLAAAEKDRDDQIAYLAHHDVRAATTLGDRIEAAARRLADFPLMGRIGRVESTRELVIARTPLIIAYHFDSDTIRILRLLHGAQQWPDRL